MRSSVLVGVALATLGFSSVAQAQEPLKWSGCYLGGHLGGAFGRDIWSANASDHFVGEATRPSALGSHDEIGVIGGGQLGCDLQVQQYIVVGLQGDFSWGRLK